MRRNEDFWLLKNNLKKKTMPFGAVWEFRSLFIIEFVFMLLQKIVKSAELSQSFWTKDNLNVIFIYNYFIE